MLGRGMRLLRDVGSGSEMAAVASVPAGVDPAAVASASASDQPASAQRFPCEFGAGPTDHTEAGVGEVDAEAQCLLVGEPRKDRAAHCG